MENITKPSRPFGLSLAIVVGVIIYSVIPLITVVTLVYLDNFNFGIEDGTMSGIDILQLPTVPLLLMVIIAVIFFVVAIFTWRGRQPALRIFFPAITVFYAIFVIGAMVNGNNGSGGLQNGVDSATQLREGGTQAYIAAIILVTVYVCWFLNRWSSRAFFRGYYTKEDLKLMQEAGWQPPKTS